MADNPFHIRWLYFMVAVSLCSGALGYVTEIRWLAPPFYWLSGVFASLIALVMFGRKLGLHKLDA